MTNQCSYCEKATNEYLKKGLCNNCYQRWKRNGVLQPQRRAKGTGSFDQQGYKIHCVNGKKYREHRLIAGAKPGQLVHHIDENPYNNDPDNLLILEGQKEHAQYHGNFGRMNKRKQS